MAKLMKTGLSGFLILMSSCADISKSAKNVHYLEVKGTPLEVQETADKLVAKKRCSFVGYLGADTSVFPGSYSTHENEIHSALRNRAAKLGANLVVANFYKKPAQGIGLICPENFLRP